MSSLGFKKQSHTASLGNKLIGRSFLGVKQSPSTVVSNNNAHSHQVSSSSPYTQFQNSKEVMYHPLGLKKSLKTTVNTLERRSKK